MSAARISAAVDAAVALGSHAIKCFPCLADKRPATPHGFKNATSDADKIRYLWEQYPGPLIGVATGEASNIDALDLDWKHEEAAGWWRAHRDRIPRTRSHQTRSGGLHLIFRHHPLMRCWAGRPVLGVDGRANGGYIIWWPGAGLPVLSDEPPTPWPTWLITQVHPEPTTTPKITIPDDRALIGLVRKVASAGEGERNSLTFWAACRVGEMVASGLIAAETAIALIVNAAVLSGLPRLEAERTAMSGIRTGLGRAAYA